MRAHRNSFDRITTAAAQAVGMKVAIEGSGAQVVEVAPDTPAAEVLERGDVIVAIDDEPAKTMRTHLARRFEEQLFEWRPYIARRYLERDDLEAEEERLVRSGRINAIGFRYVGKRLEMA